jgi:hypothetical protein
MSNLRRSLNKNARNRRGRDNPARREMNQIIKSKVSELILPSKLAELGSIGLAESDLSPAVINHLKNYNTSGNNIWSVRIPYNAFGSITQLASAELDSTYFFQFGSATASTFYAAVFDQYRITGATLTFSPRLSNANFPSGALSPRLYTVIDYDDASATTITGLTQFETLIVVPPGCGVVRTLIPHAAVAAYSGTFTSFTNVTSPWIDAASATVQHYGVKVAIEPGAAGQTVFQSYSCDAMLYMQFRNSR